jgi:hypothetical protein
LEAGLNNGWQLIKGSDDGLAPKIACGRVAHQHHIVASHSQTLDKLSVSVVVGLSKRGKC